MRTDTAPLWAMAALVLLVTALAACSGSSLVVTSTPARPTATSSPTSSLTTPPTTPMTRASSVRAVADSSVSGPISATATCPDGHVMLSGGYALSDGLNVQRAAVFEDYPASENTWTATAANPDVSGPLTLTVYADCLLACFAVTTQVVVTTPTVPNGGSLSTFVARCPVGTTVTGGGSRDDGLNGSPSGNGWQATCIPRGENPPPTVSVFALCASGSLQPGVIAESSQTVAVGGSATLSIACPTGEVLVGGGFRYYGLPSDASVDEPANDFASWQVTLADLNAEGQGSAGTLTASAVCVLIASASAAS
jgi:hypothetical protein